MSGTLICGKTTGNSVVPVLVNTDGSIEMTAEISTAGLATEAKQDDIIADLTDGTQLARCMGSEDPNDPAATQKQLHLDGSGNLLTSIVSSVNILPANSVNSGITNDPANSLAVGLRGRTDIADASTETFLLTDASGHLEVAVDDFVKGQDTMANSFPVVIASDQSVLQIQPLRDANVTAVTTTAVGANGTFTSSSLDLNGFSKMTMLGNTTNTTDEMRLEVSVDDITFFKDPTSVLYDFTTGDFTAQLNNDGSAGAIRYVRLTQTDTTTTAFSVQFGASRR
tara:strand:+ start:13087 stop:13932 length:846 start_codon:yes stop_codon:yes gene_type:complete